MKNFIILGPPASGKGTQAKLLAKRLNLYYLSSGDLMREEAKKDTETGRYFAKIQAAGIILDNDQIHDLIKSGLEAYQKSKNSNGIVLDGLPRTLDQIKLIEEIFPGEDFLVLNINVSSESVVKRISKRRVCDKCGKIFKEKIDVCSKCGSETIQRSDDKEEVVLKRLDEYKKQTEPVVNYFRQKGNLIEVDGEPSIEEVDRQVWEKIKDKVG